MSTSSSPSGRDDGPSDRTGNPLRWDDGASRREGAGGRERGSRVGLGLLFLALAGMALGVLGLVAFWFRRLRRAR